MEQIVSLRPFVPARDIAISRRFYQALGFAVTMEHDKIVILKQDSYSFILQDFYEPALAENLMLQLMVRNAEEWWQRIDAADLVAAFGVREPRAPAMQSWGLKVGFLFDPSGVLWHVAEAVF